MLLQWNFFFVEKSLFILKTHKFTDSSTILFFRNVHKKPLLLGWDFNCNLFVEIKTDKFKKENSYGQLILQDQMMTYWALVRVFRFFMVQKLFLLVFVLWISFVVGAVCLNFWFFLVCFSVEIVKEKENEEVLRQHEEGKPLGIAATRWN